MSWFQENKFAGTLIGVTVVVSGVLVFLGFSAGSEADDAKARERAAVQKINNLQSVGTYPSETNETNLNANLMEYATEAGNFQEDLLKYRPEAMEERSPDAFTSEVSKYFRKLESYYNTKKIEVRADGKPHFGLGNYAGNMAKQSETAILSYNKQALEWLFMTLADAGINKLEHVYRAPEAEALSNVEEPVDSKKNRRSTTESLKVADVLPIEISFTGSEESLQKFLTDVAASEEYFFTVKLIKILNENRSPISISQSTFELEEVLETDEEFTDEAPAFGDLGSGGVETNDFTADKTIIKQVIGSEQITVFLKLELILFKGKETVQIPRLEEEKQK